MGDLLMLLVATFGATLIRFGRVDVAVSFENSPVQLEYAELAIIVSALWLWFLALSRLYDVERLYWGAGSSHASPGRCRWVSWHSSS